jgi:hypothetical protein
LEKLCVAVPNYDMETILGDFVAKSEKDSFLYPAYGGCSLHNKTNDDGKRMVNFTQGRDVAFSGTLYQHKDICKVTWRSPENKIYNQTDHVLVRIHCTNVCNVKHIRGAEIESNHF